MSKKDYEKAASIAQGFGYALSPKQRPVTYVSVVDAFVALFKGNERFNEDRFRRACVPGANVRARS